MMFFMLYIGDIRIYMHTSHTAMVSSNTHPYLKNVPVFKMV